jgi:hypothetical protein
LSGQDLGEFVKFVPAIRRGKLSFPRHLFYVQPLAMAVVLVLLSVSQHMPYWRWLRAAMLFASMATLLGLLPPAWGHPRELFGSEFRLQGLGLLLGAGTIAAHGLLRRLSLRATSTLVLILALLALVAPHAAFWAVRPMVWQAYGILGLRLGWGLWLHIAAWLGMAVPAGILLIGGRQGHSRPDPAC